MDDEDLGRAAVLAEARTWLRTPYLHRGRSKGPNGCVDCLQFIWATYYACGLAPFVELQDYSPDEHLHSGDERYLDGVLRYAVEVSTPKPADIALFKVGRRFWHGAIVLETGWPNIIHAWARARFVSEGRADGGDLAGRCVRFFSKWQVSTEHLHDLTQP
jgi:cell wall-associated NlpC family hydrolase